MVSLLMQANAVFFDRDGVLNKASVSNGKPYAPTKYQDFELCLGVVRNLEILKARNFLIIVVTNQPDIGNGVTHLKEVQLMHKKLMETHLIDKIYMCSHKQDDNCSCRKPNIKMFMDAKQKFNIDMSSSWLVGDRWSDILAGINAGVNPILIDYGYSETEGKLPPCIKVKDFQTAIKKIVTS